MLKYYSIPPLLFILQLANSQTIMLNIKSNISESELRSELSIYPSHMLRMVKWIKITDLENGVCGLAHWDGIELDGTYSKTVCIATVHHELSSIFLKQPKYAQRYDSMKRYFYKLNDNKVAYYTHHGYKDLPIVDLTDSEKNFFVGNSYSISSFENDFNTICELLFTNGNELLDELKVRPNSVIENKILSVIGYYHSLDAKFTMDYFLKR